MTSSERITLRGSPVVVAPGKMFLIGEYAVLDGAPAIVTAVGRLATGQFVPGIEAGSALVKEAVALALSGIGDHAAALPEGSVMVDTSAFSTGGHKLGLGSSAAVAVVSVAAVLEMAGLPVAGNRELCFSLAERAHRQAQGGVGSGADVAAAVHGGVIRYRRPTAGAPVVDKVRLPPDLHLVVFGEGKPASTPDLVRAVQSLAEREPARYLQAMQRLCAEAEAFVEALAAGNVAALIAAAGAYEEGLVALGQAAGVAIVTPRFEIASELASNLGGVAKPSGAGGGDVGVAFFSEAAAARNFTSRLRQLGLLVVDAGFDANGVRRKQRTDNL